MKKIGAVLVILALSAGPLFAQSASRSIEKVTGDVYRFQNNFHVNVFVITDEGVVVTDPINDAAAIWLRGEIARLTDQPLSHLIYSHSHGDHASGGQRFGNVGTVIAQQNAPDKIDGVSPTHRFENAMQLSLGGKTFELSYLGPGHGADLIAMVIRPENVAFVVDAVSSRRLFYRDFPNANVDDWIKQVEKVQSLDFDILVGGHGPVGVKADVDDGLAYLKELRAAVLAGLKAGQSLDQLKDSISMEKYSDWAAYDQWRGLNIEGMARHLIASGALE